MKKALLLVAALGVAFAAIFVVLQILLGQIEFLQLPRE